MRISVAAILLILLVPSYALSQEGSAPIAASDIAAYKLGAGDKVRQTVFGEEGLGGEFAINGEGALSLPLIGTVHAAGLTTVELAQVVTNKLKEGYLLDPKVTIEVANFRPYYIMGEVNKTGEYSYTDGLNIVNAIARAEGFTYRAQQKRIYIKHMGESEETLVPLTNDLKVLPGDTIRIPERRW